ncbi:carboxypeptidase regulatory-like domain-containing protein [Tannerella forsythia]
MDRTYKILLILSLILGVMQPVQAQHILKGVVYDEAGTGVFSTTLRVLTEDSVFVSGGITDGNGDFEIKNIKAGKYILAVSNIGYAGQFIAFEMPGSDYTLPAVVLKTDVVALGEVTVRGSTFIRKKDHLLVIPDKQQIKHAFSGYDLLYNLMIPGLDVNRKDKKVTATTGEATLYINGVKADFRDVQNLRPRDIEKVEYYILHLAHRKIYGRRGLHQLYYQNIHDRRLCKYGSRTKDRLFGGQLRCGCQVIS